MADVRFCQIYDSRKHGMLKRDDVPVKSKLAQRNEFVRRAKPSNATATSISKLGSTAAAGAALQPPPPPPPLLLELDPLAPELAPPGAPVPTVAAAVRTAALASMMPAPQIWVVQVPPLGKAWAVLWMIDLI